MNPPEDPEALLRAAVARPSKDVVFVAGTGVSMAATWDPVAKSPHPSASWSGLLQHGLEWAKKHEHLTASAADHLLGVLVEEPDTESFLLVAQKIAKHMGGPKSLHYSDWLADTIGTIKASNRELLDCLEALHREGYVLATTSYDSLLLGPDETLRPVTWMDHLGLLRAARKEEANKVIFLHGYWRNPESVILDWTSYKQISRDKNYQDVLEAFWHMTTWVYVGCGINGLSDPDFGLFLETYGERASHANLWDFCLVQRNQVAEFQAEFDRRKCNIRAVAYGGQRDQLPQFLRSLLPATAAAPKGPAPIPVASEPITEFLRVTASFFQYRAPNSGGGGSGTSGRGDFRFTAEEFRSHAVHKPQVVDLALNRLRRDGCVWLEGPSAGGKTTVCLHLVNEWSPRGCVPLYLDLADDPDAEQAAREITAQAKVGQMFILDNVHAAPKAACSLLDHWKTQPNESVMVLSGWPTSTRSGQDYLSGHRHTILRVAVRTEDWIGVYQTMFRQIRGPGPLLPVPPSEVIKEWDDTFGADLVTFQYALAAGLRLEQGNAFQIELAAADRYVRDKYLKPCSPEECDDLFLLAWFSELGIALGEESTRSGFKRSLGCGLIRFTSHGRLRNHIRFQPWHRSLGRLLRGLAPRSERPQRLGEAAVANPYSAGFLAQSLRRRGEGPLAVRILEHTLDKHPSLVDWFGDNLTIGARLLRQTRELSPGRWTAIAGRLAESAEVDKLLRNAFATPLGLVIPFLRVIRPMVELGPVHDGLVKALSAEAALPGDRNRLLKQVFDAPLGEIGTFLRKTAQSEESRPLRATLGKALQTDVALAPGESRLLSKALAAPLDFLVAFIHQAGQTRDLEAVQNALVSGLAADVMAPPGQSRFLANAFTRPLHQLTSFLKATVTSRDLAPVQQALADALVADLSLPSGQGRLLNQVADAPLKQVGGFLQRVAQTSGLELLHERMGQILVAHLTAPPEKSRLISRIRGATLRQLTPLLHCTTDTPQLRPVHDALVTALTADPSVNAKPNPWPDQNHSVSLNALDMPIVALVTESTQPVNQGRFWGKVFELSLVDLMTLLESTTIVPGLKPVHDALAQVFASDAASPPAESRVAARAFEAPLDVLESVLQSAARRTETRPLYEALARILRADASLPAEKSRLVGQLFNRPLNRLLSFIQHTGQSKDLRPVHAVMVKAISADAELPADKSKFMAQAFAMSLAELTTFLRFTGQGGELKSVQRALVKALVTDLTLGSEKSQVFGRLLKAPLDDLEALLRLIPQAQEFQALNEAVNKVLWSDALLPAGRSRLLLRVLSSPLQLLAPFLRLLGKTPELGPIYRSLVKGLASDAKLPVDRSRLLQTAFNTSVSDVGLFLRFTYEDGELGPVRQALLEALVADAVPPVERSRLLRPIFNSQLNLQLNKLEVIWAAPELRPLRDAVAEVLIADSALPPQTSRLLRQARETRFANLRGFVRGVRELPGLEIVADRIEGDEICARELNRAEDGAWAPPMVSSAPTARLVPSVTAGDDEDWKTDLDKALDGREASVDGA